MGIDDDKPKSEEERVAQEQFESQQTADSELTEAEQGDIKHFLSLQEECIREREYTLQDLGGTGDPKEDYKLIQDYNRRYCGTGGAKGELGSWLFLGDPAVRQRREKAMKDAGLDFDNFKNIDPDNPRA